MKKIELQLTLNEQADAPDAQGQITVYTNLVFKCAGTGPTNLEAFQEALRKGGAWFLETIIGIPGLLLAQLGLKVKEGGN